MATVPTLATWTAGEKPTAAKLNTNIRDAGNFFRAEPACVLRAGVATSTATGAYTKINLDTSVFDNDGMGDLVNDNILINTAGLYRVTGQAGVVGNATGIRRLVIRKVTGSVHLARAEIPAGSTGNTPFLNISGYSYFAVGDRIELTYNQSSGGALLTVAGAGEEAFLCAEWIAA